MTGEMGEKRQQAQKDLAQACPVRNVLDRIGDQWSLLVLLRLTSGRLRFNELLRALPDISKQMLSRTLKKLEQDGLIERRLYPEVPPRVEYELSPLGLSLLTPVKKLVEWADQHHADISLARQNYQARQELLTFR